ncbi:MmgE/PrpD family protein [Desulfobacula sp.]|uniref:MmgE/PrpD family protein n=1 Tax=Desulfobacula sp. TaxID=2593537 RepID=UPI00262E723C|nr:MmgE/PrpD family protein [Desulfobacula sp.]
MNCHDRLTDAGISNMSISSILAKYVVETSYDEIDHQAVEMARRSLLDAVGVTLAASGLTASCQPFVELAMESRGKKESTILGYGKKVSAEMAAFANGSMAHAIDFEDAHDLALVHPNAPLVPAALALAESIGTVSGKEFIAAMALGCDIVCRLGLALGVNPIAFGWYIPPVLGAFGATAAAGKLLHLNAVQLLDAFSLTLCQTTCSAELRYNPHSDIRAVRDAFASKAGVVSVLLAKKGIKGFALPFEGKAGLFSLYARGNYDPSALTRNMGKVYEGANISFKPWPTCRGTHTYIEAALGLMAEYPINIHDIAAVNIIVSPFNSMLCEPLEAKRHPAIAIDAKFSLPFVIATALCHKDVALNRFTADAMNDGKVLGLARKVAYTVNPDPGLTNILQGIVEIKMKDSTVVSKKVTHALGSPENPMSKKDLVAKFIDCAKQSVNPLSMEQLDIAAQKILFLDKMKNMNELIHFIS